MESLRDILKRVMAQNAGRARAVSLASPRDEQPVPSTPLCPKCNGRGWYTPNVPIDDPRFGSIVRCECQAEIAQRDKLRGLRLYSNIGALERLKFSALDMQLPLEENRACFAAAVEEAMTFAAKPSGWLVVCGPPGSGKTHIAAAIANSLVESGQVALYMPVASLLDSLRPHYGAENDLSYSQVYETVSTAPVLVIDGLGTHNETPWAIEKLLQVFDHRFNTLLPTVVTTSSPLGALDPHIGSKLQNDKVSTIVRTATAVSGEVSYPALLPPPTLLKRMTFDQFLIVKPEASEDANRSLQAAARAAHTFAECPEGWLSLIGPTGVGKTHLAVAVVGHLLKHSDTSVAFTRVQQLINALQSTLSPRSPVSLDELMERVSNTGVLVLDDLGSESLRDWSRAMLHEIVAYRHDAELPTIVTTRVGLLDELGPIASRLTDAQLSTTVTILSRDHRRYQQG
ncbi:MAG: ATP-binding protein [Chloroflexota bacterium]|nr:ATP-binding protein [Chloroflexota bacterium]